MRILLTGDKNVVGGSDILDIGGIFTDVADGRNVGDEYDVIIVFIQVEPRVIRYITCSIYILYYTLRKENKAIQTR